MCCIKVYNESGILPNFLGLFHNGREIDKDETIESASILSGDTIVCREIDRIDMSDDDPAVEQERGFGGTALTGRISQYHFDYALLLWHRARD